MVSVSGAGTLGRRGHMGAGCQVEWLCRWLLGLAGWRSRARRTGSGPASAAAVLCRRRAARQAAAITSSSLMARTSRLGPPSGPTGAGEERREGRGGEGREERGAAFAPQLRTQGLSIRGRCAGRCVDRPSGAPQSPSLGRFSGNPHGADLPEVHQHDHYIGLLQQRLHFALMTLGRAAGSHSCKIFRSWHRW